MRDALQNVSTLLVKSLLLLTVLATAITATGTTIIPSHFSQPLLFDGKIVFCGPESGPNRVICIDSTTGKKLWERRTKNLPSIARYQGNKLAVVDGGRIFACDLKSGRLSRIFKSSAENLFLWESKDPILLLAVEENSSDSKTVSAILPSKRKKLWAFNDFETALFDDPEQIVFSRRSKAPDPSKDSGSQIIAVSKKDGRKLWNTSFPSSLELVDRIPVGPYLVIKEGDSLHAINLKSGAIAGKTTLPSEWKSTSLLATNETLMVWSRSGEKGQPEVISLHSFSVPELARQDIPDGNPLARMDIKLWWRPIEIVGNQFIARGMSIESFNRNTGSKLWSVNVDESDDIRAGKICFSAENREGSLTWIGIIDLETGVARKLYEEATRRKLGSYNNFW